MDNNYGNCSNDISREEIQSAIAKAVELRALHAALIHGNSPPNLKFPFSSPTSLSVSQFSAQDYPVFTPSYEDEHHHQVPKSRTISETWSDYGVEPANSFETFLSDFKTKLNPSEDQKSFTSSCKGHSNNNKITLLQSSKPSSTYSGPENAKNSNIVVPWTDSHSSLQSNPKKGVISRLFPKLKKKQKNNESSFSPNQTGSEDLGVLSIETLKRELSEANENRDAALMEVAEMKSSIGELRQKLEHLESYCEELKKALKQAKGSNFRGKNGENVMPVTEEVMVEGFLQIVSEARLSVKQFCKTLVGLIEETDSTLIDSLNSVLQPYKLSMNYSKYSKPVLYHLEAVMNQTLYQDFENPVFQKNGAPFHLDPLQDRQANFASFVALRNLSWNEVLRKGTKYYSEEFSKFCDQKMSLIIGALNYTRAWPEQLLQAFFVAAKCIWLLHLLAFSFSPPLRILRVEENRGFDPNYMEDLVSERGKLGGSGRVKVMVTPGFYVQDRVLRCKIICSFKPGG